MSKYAIAFIMPTDKMQLCHKVVEGESEDVALRTFFNENISEIYSNDDHGFLYFKEDFCDEVSGSIIEVG